MSTIQVMGAEVFYVGRRPVPERYPPVVLIHGAGGSHQLWLYQVRDLPQARTYALDLPGHGRSQGLGRDRIAAYGDWLVAFLDAVGVEKAVLVGHSMGGGIALDVALRYQGRVAGLGLVATGARMPVAPTLLEQIQRDPEAAVRLIVQWSYGPEADQEVVRQGRRQLQQTAPDVLYGDFVACDAFDVRDRLGQISAPACLLFGTQDRMTPAKYAPGLRDGLPDAVLHLVEGAGHMILVEQPQAVTRTLTALLHAIAR
ncbi:MAG: alpha/beta fold hydrolase [Anaerolineae bacterium]